MQYFFETYGAFFLMYTHTHTISFTVLNLIKPKLH